MTETMNTMAADLIWTEHMLLPTDRIMWQTTHPTLGVMHARIDDDGRWTVHAAEYADRCMDRAVFAVDPDRAAAVRDLELQARHLDTCRMYGMAY